jgi:DNA-binding YbaB/EbfC family protein
MFGDMMGMMGKLQEAQKKVEATKERLKTVYVEHKSNDHLICVRLTADREIKSIDIDEQLLSDKDMLEDYLILHVNKAIEKATNIYDTELAAVAKEGMPNIPGMDMFK